MCWPLGCTDSDSTNPNSTNIIFSLVVIRNRQLHIYHFDWLYIILSIGQMALFAPTNKIIINSDNI